MGKLENTLTDMKCDVCQRQPVIGVASSAFGAVSHAFCAECANKPAEPAYMFAYLYYDVGTFGEGLIDLSAWFTYVDGEYVSWDNWKAKERASTEHYFEYEAEACSKCGIQVDEDPAATPCDNHLVQEYLNGHR